MSSSVPASSVSCPGGDRTRSPSAPARLRRRTRPRLPAPGRDRRGGGEASIRRSPRDPRNSAHVELVEHARQVAAQRRHVPEVVARRSGHQIQTQTFGQLGREVELRLGFGDVSQQRQHRAQVASVTRLGDGSRRQPPALARSRSGVGKPRRARPSSTARSPTGLRRGPARCRGRGPRRHAQERHGLVQLTEVRNGERQAGHDTRRQLLVPRRARGIDAAWSSPRASTNRPVSRIANPITQVNRARASRSAVPCESRSSWARSLAARGSTLTSSRSRSASVTRAPFTPRTVLVRAQIAAGRPGTDHNVIHAIETE